MITHLMTIPHPPRFNGLHLEKPNCMQRQLCNSPRQHHCRLQLSMAHQGFHLRLGSDQMAKLYRHRAILQLLEWRAITQARSAEDLRTIARYMDLRHLIVLLNRAIHRRPGT